MSEFNLDFIPDENMTGPLVGALVEFLRDMDRPYASMPADKQEEIIAKMNTAITDMARMIYAAAHDRPPISESASVDQIVFKDGCKLVLKLPAFGKIAASAPEITGGTVHVVIPRDEELIGGERPQLDPEQQMFDHEPLPISDHTDEADNGRD